MEVVFFEGVQRRLLFCLDHLNCAKMEAFNLFLGSGKQKSRVGGDDSHVVFGKKNPWWKRKCETVRCRDATGSSFVAKVRGEVFTHFHAVAVDVTAVVCGIDCLGSQDELFVNNFPRCERQL
jgi:hypothetical protein